MQPGFRSFRPGKVHALAVMEGNKQELLGKDPTAQSVTLNTFLLPLVVPALVASMCYGL